MSDHAVQRSDSDEGLKPFFSIPINRESLLPYQSRWMAHWMQPCSSSSSQACKHHVISDASNKDHKKEQRYLPVESWKSREANVLSIDMNRRSTFERVSIRRSNPDELNLTSGVLQYAEAEKDKFNITSNSVVRKNVCSSDSRAVSSSKLSLQQLPDSSLNRENFTTDHVMNSENVNSKWEQFPMFGIHQKIESILAPMKKSGSGTMCGRMSEPHLPLSESILAPHRIKFASQDHQSISKYTDQGMRPHKSIEGLLTYRDDLAGSSHLELHRFKCDRSDMRSCMCIKEKNNPFDSHKKSFASASLTHLNHELCNCPNRSTFLISDAKNDCKTIATSFGSSWSRLKDGSMQVLRNSCPDDIPFPLLDGERDKGIRNGAGSELLPIHKSICGSHKVDSSGCVHMSRKMPKCSIHDVAALGVCTTSNSLADSKVGPQKGSNATQYLLITKKTGIDLHHGDHMIRESTISDEVKGTAFFQMSTFPSKSHCHGCEANLQPPVSSRNGEEWGNGVVNDTHFMETLNGSSDKTDSMYINISQIPSSAGLTSSSSQKDVRCPNLTKSKPIAASPIQQAFFDNPTFASNRVLSTSRTESMDAHQKISHLEEPDNFKPLLESPSIPEPSNRWIKRLRLNPFDSPVLATKRFKTGEAPYSGEVPNSFSRLLDYDKSNSNMCKRLEVRRDSDNTLSLTNNDECSSREWKAMNRWIRRWCRGGQKAAPHARSATPVLCEPEKFRWCRANQQAASRSKLATPVLCKQDDSKVGHGEFEGKHFPSITAMALMGKAANNSHPCKFRKKGSCLVWNVERF